jgi:protein-S-isoprenylcysteine O-methyltransferase Ste14
MPFQTIGEDWPFVISATSVFALSILVSVLDFVQLQGASFRLGIVNILGIALFVVGIAIRMVGRMTLGKYYSYGLKTSPDQRLIEHGIYRRIRHPITLAAMIYSLGIPLIVSSVYGLLVMLGLVSLFLYRIRIEERMLIERFGVEYREYVRKTKKLIPYIY